jgi:hypothetical protein
MVALGNYRPVADVCTVPAGSTKRLIALGSSHQYLIWSIEILKQVMKQIPRVLPVVSCHSRLTVAVMLLLVRLQVQPMPVTPPS